MKRLAWLLALVLGAASVGRTQTATGRMSGSVIDPQGLPVAGASVSATNEDTGLRLMDVTNVVGGFLFVDVPSGVYTVEVETSGFRREVIRRFKVDIAKDNVLPPVRLQLGAVAESVEVTAGGGQVQTSNAELTTTVTMPQIQHLPLLERDPLSLTSLQAGVAFNGASADNGTVINGQRTSFANVTLDGINIQDNYIRDNALNFLPTRLLVDNVSEFTITVQNGSSALGLGSSQVNFITPSGTNLYHGSIYSFNRNNALAANQWFSNKSGTPKPFLNLNQFGGSLGGPIVRNKLLFYANYEGSRERSEEIANRTILTADARRGVFTYLDPQNRLQTINVLSSAGLAADSRVAQILQNVPGPEFINNFDVGDSTPSLLRNTGGYQFNTRASDVRDNVTSRLDYMRSTRHMFSGTYRYNRESQDRPDAGVGFHAIPPVVSDVHVHFLSAAWRWNPTSALTNELRVGMNIAPGKFTSSENRGDKLFDGFVFTNPVVNFDLQGRDTNTYNYMDNANWERGKHSFRFGTQIQHIYASPFDGAGLIPTYSIGFSPDNSFALTSNRFPSRISSTDLDNANGLLGTLAGIVNSASQTFNIADRNSGFVANQEFRRHYRLNNYSFYGQDQWRLFRKLTLNVGLRWEYAGRFDERDGLILSPIITSLGVVKTLRSDAIIDFAGKAVDRPLYHKDLNNFAPNIGVAFDPFGDGRTVIRAGYAINYVNDQSILAAENAALGNHGLQDTINLFDLDVEQNATVGGKLPVIKAPTFQIPRNASDNFALDPGAALYAVDPRLRTPYVQQWTLGIQRQIARDTVVEARYAGNHGTKLLRGFDYNQIIVKENGFLDDFIRARRNGFLAEAATGSFVPNFNPFTPGSQQLKVFPQLPFGGFLNFGIVQSLLRAGEVGELAAVYYVNGITGPIQFTANPNTFVADLLTNHSNSTYNALQTEIRRRLAGGMEFQANYTLSKVLTDSSGTQVRFQPFLDFGNGGIERARADFDVTHVFNANFVAPLPVGRGHRVHYGPLDRIIGDWTIGSIVGWQSGSPFSIVSGRGTLNRTGRSGENTAVSSLTKSELDSIVGFRMTSDGPFIIDSAAINPQDQTGVAGDGEAPFKGQVFFHPDPGQLGTLQRRMFNNPSVFALDLKIDKEIPIRERQRLRIETTFSNLFNHPVFAAGNQSLDSTQFGRIKSTLVGSRVIQVGGRFTF